MPKWIGFSAPDGTKTACITMQAVFLAFAGPPVFSVKDHIIKICAGKEQFPQRSVIGLSGIAGHVLHGPSGMFRGRHFQDRGLPVFQKRHFKITFSVLRGNIQYMRKKEKTCTDFLKIKNIFSTLTVPDRRNIMEINWIAGGGSFFI